MESRTGVLQMPVGSTLPAEEVVVHGDGAPVFLVAGREANGEFHCAGCGYGVIVRSALPACPMCRGTVWEDPAGSPFSY